VNEGERRAGRWVGVRSTPTAVTRGSVDTSRHGASAVCIGAASRRGRPPSAAKLTGRHVFVIFVVQNSVRLRSLRFSCETVPFYEAFARQAPCCCIDVTGADLLLAMRSAEVTSWLCLPRALRRGNSPSHVWVGARHGPWTSSRLLSGTRAWRGSLRLYASRPTTCADGTSSVAVRTNVRDPETVSYTPPT